MCLLSILSISSIAALDRCGMATSCGECVAGNIIDGHAECLWCASSETCRSVPQDKHENMISCDEVPPVFHEAQCDCFDFEIRPDRDPAEMCSQCVEKVSCLCTFLGDGDGDGDDVGDGDGVGNGSQTETELLAMAMAMAMMMDKVMRGGDAG